MASPHNFSVDDKDLADAELWAVIDSAAASHSSTTTRSRKPLTIKQSPPSQSLHTSFNLPQSPKYSRNYSSTVEDDGDGSRVSPDGEVLQNNQRPRNVARMNGGSGYGDENRMIVVSHQPLQRTPKTPTPCSCSSPDCGREIVSPVSESSPTCFRRNKSNNYRKEMVHCLSGRFPSVSMFKDYLNKAMAVSSLFLSYTVGCAMFNGNRFASMMDSRGSVRDNNFMMINWDDKYQKHVTFTHFFVLIAGPADSGLAVINRVEAAVRNFGIHSVHLVAELVQTQLICVQCEMNMPMICNEFILGSVLTEGPNLEFKEPYLLTVRTNLRIERGHVSSIGSGSEVAGNVLASYGDWADIIDEEVIVTRLVTACAEAIVQVDDCGGPLEYFSGIMNIEKRQIELEHQLLLAEIYLARKGVRMAYLSEHGELSPHKYSDTWDVLLSTRHLIRNNMIFKDEPFVRFGGLFVE